MILGLLWMMAANGAALLGAWALLKRLGTGRGSLDAVIFCVLHAALVSLAILLFGIANLLNPAALGLCGAAALAALLVRGVHRTLPAVPWKRIRRDMIFLTAVVALRLLLQAWFFAPSLGDTLGYQLPKVAEWIQAEGFTGEHGLDPRAMFPAGFELVQTWWIVFLRHDVLNELAGIQFLVMAAVAVFSVARQLGWGERPAYVAALLYALTPTLHLQATACMNDGAIAALVLATLALVLGRMNLLLLLLPMGIAMGIKGSYLYAFPGAVLLLLLVRKRPPVGAIALRWAAGAAAVGILLGSYWYARNLAVHGNPVHPLKGWGIQPVGKRFMFQAGPRVDSLLVNSKRLVDVGLRDKHTAYSPMAAYGAGWGAVLFCCGLVALPGLVRTEREFRWLAASFGVALACVLMQVVPDPWFARFALFFPALPCLAAARLAEKLKGAAVVAAMAGALQFMGTFVPAELYVGQLRDLVAQPWRTRTASMMPIPAEHREDAVVGCFGPYMNEAYWLYEPDFSRRVVYFRATTLEELTADMRRHGVRMLYAGDVNPLIRRGLENGTFKPLPRHFVALAGE